jgi:release factor glutamine methyltransferase
VRSLDLVKDIADLFERCGVPDPLVDAELLMTYAGGSDRLSLYLDNPEAGRELQTRVRRLARRRARGEPVQYIVGSVEFLGLNIKVGRGVLIPRPETELLAEEVINELKGMNVRHGRILDLCTGSGCVALAAAHAFGNCEVYGTDVSLAAIRFAETNAGINGLQNVRFLRGSLFTPVKDAGPFDVICSNPPYVNTEEIDCLQREVREWEPRRALDGGPDGLRFYRRIFSEVSGYLKDTGRVIVELGFGQAAAVAEIAGGNGFTEITIREDYAGIKRILKAGRLHQSPHLQG